MGIPPADHEKIFSRFERLVNPSEVSALGLGRFIARQITEAHAGRIWVDSQPGRGATFYAELPREDAPRNA